MDLLERLLQHDAWATRLVFEFGLGLTDAQLDRDFDIGHRSYRETAHHLVANVEGWTARMAGHDNQRPETSVPSVTRLLDRFHVAHADLWTLARQLQDGGRLDDTFLDTEDDPPEAKTFGGAILHVITHDFLHRSEMIHMLQRLGVPEAGDREFDVLTWEATLTP